MVAPENSKTVWENIEALRTKRPVVHSITNFVVMNITANALLALGASPIMAHAKEEVEDLLAFTSALVLNIGTLDSPWVESMHEAASQAGQRDIPIVLDPVGAGASRFRTETALSLIATQRPAVIRANSSEVLALCGDAISSKGVDSAHGSEDAAIAAKALAEEFECVVAVSGEVDFITDGTREIRIPGGTSMMPLITGMGCTSTALVGAFTAVAASPLEAAVSGMATMKVAAELGALKASGPGSLQVYFLDALYSLTEHEVLSRLKIQTC